MRRALGIGMVAALLWGCGSEGSSIEDLWGYDRDNGPNVWRELSPDFAICGDGMRQSPIDLVVNDAESFTPPDFDWEVSTLQVGTPFEEDNDIDFVPIEENTIEFESVEYTMSNFHFHTPAEHTIEGEFFDAGVHFVHLDDDGNILVVGVVWNAGSFNNDIERLLQAIPKPGKVGTLENFDMDALLPADAALYAYDGSLTTPPCGEGATWLVYDEPLVMSSEQLMELRAAIGGTNSRGIQPLHGRSVRLSM